MSYMEDAVGAAIGKMRTAVIIPEAGPGVKGIHGIIGMEPVDVIFVEGGKYALDYQGEFFSGYRWMPDEAAVAPQDQV